ncbi:hypothetical protein BJ085DRAFT_28089 [Dimargaris cristalligena]|uniref:Sfi1 spindle body domain-containing protein n=1 Tax=Dimargaris cristalligena TaxID=215637 RepID=A0A4P9ZQT5_9FUNG|nr:hypothetical protein BJ085DRAFT_28089 [Dimargaris cristalligena]|eukprot:RKP35854.1 hypothetical protein BJ085DRAFT_28089 [Dimargaris cristalligena]
MRWALRTMRQKIDYPPVSKNGIVYQTPSCELLELDEPLAEAHYETALKRHCLARWSEQLCAHRSAIALVDQHEMSLKSTTLQHHLDRLADQYYKRKVLDRLYASVKDQIQLSSYQVYLDRRILQRAYRLWEFGCASRLYDRDCRFQVLALWRQQLGAVQATRIYNQLAETHQKTAIFHHMHARVNLNHYQRQRAITSKHDVLERWQSATQVVQYKTGIAGSLNEKGRDSIARKFLIQWAHASEAYQRESQVAQRLVPACPSLIGGGLVCNLSAQKWVQVAGSASRLRRLSKLQARAEQINQRKLLTNTMACFHQTKTGFDRSMVLVDNFKVGRIEERRSSAFHAWRKSAVAVTRAFNTIATSVDRHQKTTTWNRWGRTLMIHKADAFGQRSKRSGTAGCRSDTWGHSIASGK